MKLKMTAPFLLASLHLAVRNVPGCGDAAPSLSKRLFVSELYDDVRLKGLKRCVCVLEQKDV